jgi:pimeloyl-ACP methyl ester carboxylesterase
MPEVEVKGAIVNYRQRGKGDTLLLVHGWNASSAMWALNLRGLAAGRRVIAVDLPGHGGSGLPGGFEPDLAGYAGFLEDLRRALYLPSFELVGHSMGGCIALSYALSHPGRVSRLVLVGTPARRQAINRLSRVPVPGYGFELFHRAQGPRLRSYMLKRSLANPGEVPPEAFEENVRAAAVESHAVFRATSSFVRRVSFDEEEISRLDRPVLLLWGEEDKTVSAKEAYRLRELLPRANLAFIPRAGHSPQLESPRLFDELVLRFIQAG